MKGIPASSIKSDGERYEITNKSLFERVYNHKVGDDAIEITYNTLQKKLFGNTCTSSHIQTRTIHSSHDYKEYN
jgi:hypothetical protein